MKRTLLIDADIVAYKFASANEEVWYFNGKDQPPATKDDPESACDEAHLYVCDLMDRLRANDVIICLSDPDANWKKDLWPGYKANRVGVRKPASLLTVKKHLARSFPSYQRPRLEADDIIGILATHPTLVEGEKIIVSEDKDMLGIPGKVYNPKKDSKHVVSELQADLWHLWQTIVGDTSDGYPGAPGIGKKSQEAQMVLLSKNVEEAWSWVLAAFHRSHRKVTGMSGAHDEIMAAAVQQARLARICRHTDYDFENRRPIPWNPPR